MRPNISKSANAGRAPGARDKSRILSLLRRNAAAGSSAAAKKSKVEDAADLSRLIVEGWLSDLVRRTCHRYWLTQDEADDVTQYVAMVLWENRPVTHVFTFASLTALNYCETQRRKRKRERVTTNPEELLDTRSMSPEDLVSRAEEDERVVQAVSALSGDQQVFLCRFFCGFRLADVVEISGLSLATVWRRERAALELVRKGLLGKTATSNAVGLGNPHTNQKARQVA